MGVDIPPTRRAFLDWIVSAFTAVTGAAVSLPAILYLWPAARGGESESAEVEGAQGMTPGQSRTIQIGGKAVIVVRDRNGFKAFSAICTHLGCLVVWSQGKNGFLCPCHAAMFDSEGRVVSGPPSAPLPKYKVKEVGERVFVTAA